MIVRNHNVYGTRVCVCVTFLGMITASTAATGFVLLLMGMGGESMSLSWQRDRPITTTTQKRFVWTAAPAFHLRGGSSDPTNDDSLRIVDENTHIQVIEEAEAASESSPLSSSSEALPSQSQSSQSQRHLPSSVHVASGDAALSSSSVMTTSLSSLSFLTRFATFYSSQIRATPIRTKSLTAGLVFGVSDFLAQKMEAMNNRHNTSTGSNSKNSKNNSNSNQKETRSKIPGRLDWIRLWTSVAVGLLYYGPAAHYWYETVFQLLPSTSLGSTLQKAVWGQLIFGPSFTCVFFAASLWQSSGHFSFHRWLDKIRSDLPTAWLTGIGFWPLMDLIAYSFIDKDFIPLFMNACSLVWTIYLSVLANR